MIEKSLVTEVEKIVRKVGMFILQESKHFDKSKIQNKNTYDLVSYVDIESEKRLIEELSKLLPEAGFITEESHLHSSKSLNWIIDPLDGTTNFTRNLPTYAISVALADNQNILMGIVFNIPVNEMFTGMKHQGAYLNGEKISVSQSPSLAESLIVTGFSVSTFDKVDVHLSVVKEIITHSLGIRRLGSAAVDLCYVACGRFDAFFEWYLNPWDVAAGSVIAMEAGAIVSDFSGKNNYLFNKEILAAQPNVFQTILHIIQNKSSYEKFI